MDRIEEDKRSLLRELLFEITTVGSRLEAIKKIERFSSELYYPLEAVFSEDWDRLKSEIKDGYPEQFPTVFCKTGALLTASLRMGALGRSSDQ